jgi:RNA polymerase sigma-70 factor (ECF subfamily)
MAPGNSDSVRATAEAVARHSYGKLVAFLTVRTRDVAGAEDVLSEAFLAALDDWPTTGVPANPEGWLTTVARRKLIDAARRRAVSESVVDQLRIVAETAEDHDMGTRLPDDRLALMLVCSHPEIDPAIRAPLMLQTVLGFDAATIASAFLTSPSAMGQRLVRAKRKILEARLAFEIPERSALRERLDAVLQAVYAAFARGWSDIAGEDIQPRNVAAEAIWLGRLTVSLLPDEPEALGLLALMLHADARRHARRTPDGRYVPLAQQDTALWDHALIGEAEDLLARAARLGVIGRFQLEAAVHSAHAIRHRTGRSDWAAIELLYDGLHAMTGSPVVGVNRAIAAAETKGEAVGLDMLEALASDRRLDGYQPYWAARAELAARCSKVDMAREAYLQAMGLESDPAVRAFLQHRLAALPRSQG